MSPGMIFAHQDVSRRLWGTPYNHCPRIARATRSESYIRSLRVTNGATFIPSSWGIALLRGVSCAVMLCSALIFSPLGGVQKLLNPTKIVDNRGHRLAVAPPCAFFFCSWDCFLKWLLASGRSVEFVAAPGRGALGGSCTASPLDGSTRT